jgi:hypothetical protein
MLGKKSPAHVRACIGQKGINAMEETRSAGYSGKPGVTNRFEAVSCQACGRKVKRQSRQQRYCSDRCRDFARRENKARTAIKNLPGYLHSGEPSIKPTLQSEKPERLVTDTAGTVTALEFDGHTCLTAGRAAFGIGHNAGPALDERDLRGMPQDMSGYYEMTG